MIYSKQQSPSFTKSEQSLAGFDGHRIAVVMNQGGQQVVLKGRALYTRDTKLGNVLRISVESSDAGDPVIVVSEDQWNGRIIPDLEHGCTFCLISG